MRPLCVMLDSNGVDPLIDIEDAYEVLDAAVRGGRLEVLFTHVLIDEVAKTPDVERRIRLLLAVIGVGNLVPTGAFVLGASRLGRARITAHSPGQGVVTTAGKHTNDALIEVTAAYENAILITADRRLTARAAQHGIAVYTMPALIEHLRTDLLGDRDEYSADDS